MKRVAISKGCAIIFQLHRIVTVRQAKPELTADLWGNSRFLFWNEGKRWLLENIE